MTQKEALEILKMGHNAYLTGAPGSGKTFLLNEYIRFLKGRGVKTGITASTGIAATHLNGLTIHSWAGIGIKERLSAFDMDRLAKKRGLASKIGKTKVLVIDEVSMLHSFRLDMVDEVCRFLRGDERPFGGIQVVLCGDFFQLPPISKGNEDAPFAVYSKVWGKMNPRICYLEEQHRHCGHSLIQVLRDIREDGVSERTMERLRARYKKETPGGATKLYTHNIDVDSINEKRLDSLKGEEYVYAMETNKGGGAAIEALKKNCLAPEKLRLKKGAAVMFVKNNPEKRYFNGTLGTVLGFDSCGIPLIQIADGRKILVQREDWNVEEDGKIKASVSQIPLRLAWAITIHKSQGMSLDAAEMDLSKSFTEGMGYVALSRVRTMEGLNLSGLNDMALKVNKKILEFDGELARMSEEAAKELRSRDRTEIRNIQEEFLGPAAPVGGEKKVGTYDITKAMVEKETPVAEMAEEREMTEETIINHIEKLVERGDELNLEYLKPRPDRFEKIKNAFEKSKGKKLAPVRKILGSRFSYNEIKLARLFL